jgi:hypothetical protein
MAKTAPRRCSPCVFALQSVPQLSGAVLLACQTADGNLAQPIAFQVLESLTSDSRRLVLGEWGGKPTSSLKSLRDAIDTDASSAPATLDESPAPMIVKSSPIVDVLSAPELWA